MKSLLPLLFILFFIPSWGQKNSEPKVKKTEEGKYGVEDSTGKWIVQPEFDLISPIVNNQFIGLKGTRFIVFDDFKKIKSIEGPFDTDYIEYSDVAEKSDLEDKDLIVRIIEMYFDGHHYELNDTKMTLSKTMLYDESTTKWILSKIL